MKNTNKLLAVVLAVAIAISGIVITTMTTSAIDVTVDNTKDVIATVKGSDIAGDGDGGNATAYSRDEEAGTFSFNGDCGNFYGIYLKGVEAGVYKVAYYLTIDNVTGGDRIRFKPYGGDVYYNVGYGTLRQYEGMKVMVVAVINATGDFEVGGWPATGLYGTIDKVEIAKADYDFGANSGDYLLIEEGIAHDIPGGYTQPAEDQWTPSTKNVPTTTTVLNTQAWTYDFSEANYKALFGDGEHGTNGDTVKATVAAGTDLTVRDCPATGAPNMNLNADGYVIQYTGVIVAEESGWYQLASYYIDNNYVAYVGGEKVFDYGRWDNWFDNGEFMYCGETFYMEAGVKYAYEAYYVEQGGGDNIQPIILVDGYNRSFATAGISFYADVEADANAVPEVNSAAPALEETNDDVLFYQDFAGASITEDSQAVDIGMEKISGKTDIVIEAVIKPFNINREKGWMTDNSGLIGIGEQDDTSKYILLGYMGNGRLKVGVKSSAGVEKQTERGILNTNKWVTLKYVFTAESVKTYADGILVCENDISSEASIGDFTGKFLIGDITSWPDPGFRGQVGAVRVTTPKAAEEGPVYPEINPYETIKAGVDATELSVGQTIEGNVFGVEQNAGDNEGGVGGTYNGAWMKYANVVFGETGAAKVTINYVSRGSRMAEDAAAEIWVGGMEGTGTKVGTVNLLVPEDPAAPYTPMIATADLDAVVTGTKDVYVVLTGTTDSHENEYIANVTSFVFAEAVEEQPEAPVYPAEDCIVETIEKDIDLSERNNWDAYDEYVFENVAAGVYKIAYYFTINGTQTNDQVRVSPKVYGEGKDIARVWIDFPYSEVKTFVDPNGITKGILVAVITVPEGYNKIDAGFYPNPVDMVVNKVSLATANYDFINDTEYTWIVEKATNGNPSEGAGAQLAVAEGAWTASTRPQIEGGEQTPSIPTLGETDKDVLFYTDFSDISDLIVKEAGKASADAAASQITLDADGNMVMTRDQYIDLGAALLNGKTNVTIEFVVKPDAIVNHAAFAGLGVGDDAGWMVLGMQDGGAIKFGMKSNDIELGGQDSGKSEGGLLVVGEWVTIRYEITETSVTMFVNDVAVKNPAGTEVMSFDLTGQKTLSELANLEGAQFAFGKETKWGDAGFTGTVSEIRVTTTAAEGGNGAGDGSTNKPITGDVASMVAILAAGAAALGGLKLRKKSK